jgi:hypothetical protein
VKLALKCPELLSYEEDLIWKVIKDNGFFWSTERQSVYIDRIREHYDLIKQVAEGKLPSYAFQEQKGK